jgi:DNA-binding cell septation regulator SpoVG
LRDEIKPMPFASLYYKDSAGCKNLEKGGFMNNVIEVSVERLYRMDSDGPLKAFADISICKSFIVKGLRVIAGKKGLFVGMPQQLGKDGKWHNRVFLTDDSMKERLSELVLAAFEQE